MLRFITLILFLSFALTAVACDTPPTSVGNPTNAAPVAPVMGDGITTVAYPVDKEEGASNSAEYPIEDTVAIVTPTATTAPEVTDTPIRPTETPTPVAPTPVSPRPVDDGTIIETPVSEPTTYVFQRGDTFSEVAEQFGISTADLAAHNGITNPNNIEVGQIIEIPPTDNAQQVAETEVTEEPTTAPTEELITATATPEPTATQVVVEATVVPTATPTNAPNETRTYVVQSGDSLTQLSVDFDVPLVELAAANGLQADSDLIIGQTLIIPGDAPEAESGESAESSDSAEITPTSEPTIYVVQRGDTLRDIAIEFGITEQAILDANDISDPDRILVGQALIIPEAEE